MHRAFYARRLEQWWFLIVRVKATLSGLRTVVPSRPVKQPAVIGRNRGFELALQPIPLTNFVEPEEDLR